MAFSSEEILAEFAELTVFDGVPAIGMRVQLGRPAGCTVGRETKSDAERLARRRQIARESAARAYARKTPEQRAAPMKKYLDAIRADPARYAAYLERRRQQRRK